MTPAEFKAKRDELTPFAIAAGYDELPSDSNVGRLSFIDRTLDVRLDIYLSKMTVCRMSRDFGNAYHKNKSMEQVKQIIKYPLTTTKSKAI